MKFQALADSEDEVISIEFRENHYRLNSSTSTFGCISDDSAPEASSSDDREEFITNESENDGEQLPFMVIVAFSVNYGMFL